MGAKCLVAGQEKRELDSYDLITALGLLKEHDWKVVWRRYSPNGVLDCKVNFSLSLEGHYVEMTVEKLASLALSPKYQASPHLMQALIRRLLCGHRHGLILEKLRRYGVPIEEEGQLNLSGSVGTIGVNLVVNRHPGAPEYRFHKFGTSRVEQDEQRRLYHYDVVSILYLAQKNLSDRVVEGYVPQEVLNEGSEEEKVVKFSSQAGDYQASLDFLDEGFHFITHDETASTLERTRDVLEHLLADGRLGRLIREGRLVVIAGRPNVGKSSLFNALVGTGRAIVTPVAGTTRDVLTEVVDIDGIPITLVDTAGVRDTLDEIEIEGVRRAREALQGAALTLVVLDASQPLTGEDHAVLAAVTEPRIVVVNKHDQPSVWSEVQGSGVPGSGFRV